MERGATLPSISLSLSLPRRERIVTTIIIIVMLLLVWSLISTLVSSAAQWLRVSRIYRIQSLACIVSTACQSDIKPHTNHSVSIGDRFDVAVCVLPIAVAIAEVGFFFVFLFYNITSRSIKTGPLITAFQLKSRPCRFNSCWLLGPFLFFIPVCACVFKLQFSISCNI